jgi:protein SCO1/2
VIAPEPRYAAGIDRRAATGTARRWPRTAYGLVWGIVAVLAPARTLVAQSQDPPMQLLDGVGIEQRLNEAVPLDLEFRDENGAAVRLRDYFGDKPVILNLGYFECPMLCNLTLDGMIKALRVMSFDVGKQFTVLTVSFDPKDGPKQAAQKKRSCLTRYAKDGAAGGWHVLTGKQSAITRLTDAVGFRYAWDQATGRYAHPATIIVLTPQGKVSRYLNGVEFSARDIRLGLVEASANKIGSPTDQVLLFCYQYDPTTGKYGLAIMNAVRAGGALTVLVLLTGIVVLALRERRLRRNNNDLTEAVPGSPAEQQA